MTEQYEILGDFHIDRFDLTELIKKYSTNGLLDDETIRLNWRVIEKSTGATVAVFGGSAGYEAASVYKDYCERRRISSKE